MKNLFKNLMLVAVAAMAFTACTETNDEVNAVSKTTRYEFTANIAEETRSGFAEKEEGAKAYKSEWFGDETLKVYVTDGADWSGSFPTSITNDGKFVLDLYDAPESFYMTVCSPAESWSGENTYSIPAEQTPLANSVDPAAHILKAEDVAVNSGVADINMTHMAAYGKMTVNAPEGFVISKVKVSFNGGQAYTLNAKNVENNVFWFATTPIDAVTKFTVTAYDAVGNAVAKTVDVPAEKNMSFQYGRVGTFSVSGLKETYDSTSAYIYEGAVEYNDVSYMFVAGDNSGLRIDFVGVIEDGAIPAGTYTFSTSYGMYPSWSYYYPNVDGWDATKLKYGQAVVSVKDGQYMIVFTNLADANENVVVEKFTFKGELPGLVTPDPRVKLATPELTYTNEGMVVTLSWNAIEGVEYYSVECDNAAIEDFTTTETSATITLPDYGAYGFSVAAKVADNHENFKSSDAASVKVVVKDPDAWADYELTSVAVSGSYVTMTDANDNRVTFFMNAADRIGNGIKLGDYTYIYSETPAVGQFAIYVATYDGTSKWSYQIGSGSMSVEEVNGEYKILITIDGIRFGFKGTGALGAPITDPTIIASTDTLSFVQAGGSKTVDLTVANLTEDITVHSTNDHFTADVDGNVLTVVAPENTVEAAQEATITLSANGATATITVTQEAYDPNAVVEDGSEEHPYTFASVASNGFFLNFEDATNGASLQLDRQNSDVNQMSNLGRPFALNYTAIIYAGSGCVYNDGKNVYQYASFAPYSTLEVTKADGNWTCKLKMSVDGGATFTYYTYTGQIANQAY